MTKTSMDAYTILTQNAGEKHATISARALLKKADPANFRLRDQILNPEGVTGYRADMGVGGAVTGILALSYETQKRCIENKLPVIPLSYYLKDFILQNPLPPADEDLLPRAGIILLSEEIIHSNTYLVEQNHPALMVGKRNPFFTLEMDEGTLTLVIRDEAGQLRERLCDGATVTLDGDARMLYPAPLAIAKASLPVSATSLLATADAVRAKSGLCIGTTATHGYQSKTAAEIGSEALSLIRSERMFDSEEAKRFLGDILKKAARKTLAAHDLDALEHMQFLFFGDAVKEFYEVNHPQKHLTCRLLDGRLSEFLKDGDDRPISEFIRGQAPEIHQVQIRAILRLRVLFKFLSVEPEILVPAISSAEELLEIRRMVDEEILVQQEKERLEGEEIRILDIAEGLYDPSREDRYLPREINARVGAMIETKGALQHAGEIAAVSDFVNFGGNDLEEALSGVSRATEEGKAACATLSEPVMAAIRDCIPKLRAVKPDLRITLCGDAAANAEEATVRFCHDAGIDVLCVAPVPEIMLAARIAAGKAALLAPRKTLHPRVLSTPPGDKAR